MGEYQNTFTVGQLIHFAAIIDGAGDVSLYKNFVLLTPDIMYTEWDGLIT